MDVRKDQVDEALNNKKLEEEYQNVRNYYRGMGEKLKIVVEGLKDAGWSEEQAIALLPALITVGK